MNLFKKKNNLDNADACEVSTMMDNAMSIQSRAMVNQTELNIGFQAYTIFKLKEGLTHQQSIEKAAKVVIDLQKEIEKLKEKYGY